MPEKRSATVSGSEATPRRSSRVSLKPVSSHQKPTNAKQFKSNGSTDKIKVSKAKPSKQPNHTTTKADEPDSLSELSGDESARPPPKRTKVEKSQANLHNGKKDSAESSKNKLSVGNKLDRSITLQNHEGKDTNIIELLATKGTVIFIYPKSNTPGCTNQACGYRDIYQEISNAGFQVVGLSMDSPKAQSSWKEKQKLPYTLLCDPKQQLIKLLGSSKSAASVQRSHFIFEAGGKLLHVDPKANTTTSPKEALEFIKSLGAKPCP